ncbi:MAG: penicillin-binding protein 2 [Clostridia bacterium]|nr:penicillin-binding protein 2 [Clostridia bacterium]
MMGNSKKSIKKVTVIIILMFAVIISYLLKIVIKDSGKMIVNSYNPRISSSDTTIKRGDIRDINGFVLAESVNGDNGYARKYNDAKTSCHVVGYTGAGKTGTEAVENFTLQHIDNELFQRLRSFLKGGEVEGDSVYLTIDKNLQDIASKLMKANKGAVVVEEVSTGRILCMVSKPMYDPQTLAKNWDSLKVDKTTPLVNRATQGEYTPGSIFKIVTATAAMRNLQDVDNFTYTCHGEDKFGGKVIHCFNGEAHGKENLTSGFANSCNCFFSALGDKIGVATLRKTADDLLFNTGVEFSLPYSIPSVKIDKTATESELVETSIGQGRTTVTPLFMASIVQSIANNGVMMQPYIIDHIVNYDNVTVDTTLPQALRTVFTKSECDKLKEMMIAVVNEGTGFNAKSDYFQVAGKTGTAQNPGGNDHWWFVGFAPADNPQYAVSVVLENADGSANASVIARKMLYNAINRKELK